MSECEHKFVQQYDRWCGNGKYIAFKCKDCEAELKPVWEVVSPKKEEPKS
jgi:hypothetical protein